MERQDLRDYYERFEGNMKNWLHYIPFAEKEDVCERRAAAGNRGGTK